MRVRSLPVLAVAVLLMGQAPPSTPHGATVAGTVLVVDNHGNAIANPHDVWVYLQEAHPQDLHRPGKPPGGDANYQISQKNTEFSRASLVLPLGATVAFPNRDNQEHNVFSPSDPTFDLGRYNTDPKGKPHKFEDVGEFDIYCDIHKNMVSKVKVVDTRAAWIVEVQGGSYAFSDVPPGTYNVVAWLPNSTEVRSEVVVTGTDTVKPAELHLHPGRAPATHLHKDNKTNYAPYP